MKMGRDLTLPESKAQLKAFFRRGREEKVKRKKRKNKRDLKKVQLSEVNRFTHQHRQLELSESSKSRAAPYG